jgi:hypothetical protein
MRNEKFTNEKFTTRWMEALYPLCFSLYPTKTHKTVLGSNLWFLVCHVYGKHLEPKTQSDV